MIRKTLLAAALGLALQAQAATVVVNVSSDAFDGGSLMGKTLSGSFSYDDATLTALTDWLPLIGLSFTVDGQLYTLSSSDLASATVSFMNGLPTGLDAVTLAASPYDFAFSSGFGSPYVFYQDGHDFGAANLGFSLTSASVPEPAGTALLLTALGGGLWARQRARSRHAA